MDEKNRKQISMSQNFELNSMKQNIQNHVSTISFSVNHEQQNGSNGNLKSPAEINNSSKRDSRKKLRKCADSGISCTQTSVGLNQNVEIFKKNTLTPTKPTIIVREVEMGVDPNTNEPMMVLAAHDPSTGARIVYGHPSLSSLGHRTESTALKKKGASVKIRSASDQLEVEEVHPLTDDTYGKFLSKPEDLGRQDDNDFELSEAEIIPKSIVYGIMDAFEIRDSIEVRKTAMAKAVSSIPSDVDQLEVKKFHPQTNGTYEKFSSIVNSEDLERQDVSDFQLSEAEIVSKLILQDLIAKAISLGNRTTTYMDSAVRENLQEHFGPPTTPKPSVKSIARPSQDQIKAICSRIIDQIISPTGDSKEETKDVTLSSDEVNNICRSTFEEIIASSVGIDQLISTTGDSKEETKDMTLSSDEVNQSTFDEIIASSVSIDQVIPETEQKSAEEINVSQWGEEIVTKKNSVRHTEPEDKCEDCDYWPPLKKQKGQPTPDFADKPKKRCVPWGKCQQEQNGEQNMEGHFFVMTTVQFRGKEPMKEVLNKIDVDRMHTEEMDFILNHELFQSANTNLNIKKMVIPKIVSSGTVAHDHEGIPENARSTDRSQSDMEKGIGEAHASTPTDFSSRRSARPFFRRVARKYKGFMRAARKCLKRKRQ